MFGTRYVLVYARDGGAKSDYALGFENIDARLSHEGRVLFSFPGESSMNVYCI